MLPPKWNEKKTHINSNKMNCYGGKLCNLKLRKFYNLFFSFCFYFVSSCTIHEFVLFCVCVCAQIGSFPSHQSSSRVLKRHTQYGCDTHATVSHRYVFHRSAWVCVGISTHRSVFVTLHSWNEWIFDGFNFPFVRNKIFKQNATLVLFIKT